jgi:hypothetical protein
MMKIVRRTEEILYSKKEKHQLEVRSRSFWKTEIDEEACLSDDT